MNILWAAEMRNDEQAERFSSKSSYYFKPFCNESTESFQNIILDATSPLKKGKADEQCDVFFMAKESGCIMLEWTDCDVTSQLSSVKRRSEHLINSITQFISSMSIYFLFFHFNLHVQLYHDAQLNLLDRWEPCLSLENNRLILWDIEWRRKRLRWKIGKIDQLTIKFKWAK